jgi:hypothetical protein
MSDITQKRNACFYDISEIVKIPLNNNGYVNRKSLVKVSDNSLLLAEYIQNNNIQVGDIFYIGDNSDRLEYGFALVVPDNKIIRGDYGPEIIFQYTKYLNLIKSLNVSYTNLLEQLYSDDYWLDVFFGDFDDQTYLYESCLDKYRVHGLV